MRSMFMTKLVSRVIFGYEYLVHLGIVSRYKSVKRGTHEPDLIGFMGKIEKYAVFEAKGSRRQWKMVYFLPWCGLRGKREMPHRNAAKSFFLFWRTSRFFCPKFQKELLLFDRNYIGSVWEWEWWFVKDWIIVSLKMLFQVLSNGERRSSRMTALWLLKKVGASDMSLAPTCNTQTK